MDRESAHGSAPAGGPFDALDAKLNIFALANGLDLKREEASRQVEWHRDRLERGILLESLGDGRITVSALAWNHGDLSSLQKVTQREAMDAQELAQGLSAILQETLDAANAI